MSEIKVQKSSTLPANLGLSARLLANLREDTQLKGKAQLKIWGQALTFYKLGTVLRQSAPMFILFKLRSWYCLLAWH